MFYAKTLASAALFTAINAHMQMKSPVPFPSQGKSDPAQNGAVNGPLAADGSNFPCKYSGPDTYSGGQVNSYPLGSTQTLQTIGSAVHGGGSCQISITYDTAPTKDSVWKVIHSIEGGCPSRGQSGNLPANSATFENPDTYEFTVPDNIPTGKGTIAWTWLNRIGNREFYMNCGAIEITGSGGDQASFDALPDMVVANIAGVETTQETMDIQFANPGDSVEDNLGKYGFPSVEFGGGSLGGGNSGGSPAPPASSAVAAPSSVVATPSPTASAPGGVFITDVPSVTATPAPTPSPVESAPVAAPTGGAGGSEGAACSPDGVFECIAGTSFRQCAGGQWSVVMQLAAGTQCTPGQSPSMGVAAAKGKRTIRALRV
jgi:hypothetical protein